MTDPVFQTMRQLLESMVASLEADRASQSVIDPGNRAAPVSSPVTSRTPGPSPSANQREDEDRMVQQVSSLLDEKLRALEERTLRPILDAIDRLEQRCGLAEAVVEERSEMKTITVDLHQNGENVPPTQGSASLYHGTRNPSVQAEQAGPWSGDSSEGDLESEYSFEGDGHQTGKRYIPSDSSDDAEEEDYGKGIKALSKRKIDVDGDPSAIRTLQPRPCH